MFFASKIEDILPLKINQVVENIGHNRFTADQILSLEREFMTVFKLKFQAPTVFDFLKIYLSETLDIQI